VGTGRVVEQSSSCVKLGFFPQAVKYAVKSCKLALNR
jgi:hypothetical protein